VFCRLWSNTCIAGLCAIVTYVDPRDILPGYDTKLKPLNVKKLDNDIKLMLEL